MDSTVHILNEFLLPDPKYRSMETTVGLLVFRLIIFLIGMMESSRTATFMILQGGAHLNSFLRISVYLLEKPASVKEFVHYFNLFQLAHRTMEFVVNYVFLALLTLLYWSLILGIWCCIRASTLIINSSLLLYCILIFGMAVLLTCTEFALDKGARSTEMFADTLEKNDMIAKWTYAKYKSKKNRRFVKIIDSLKSIQLKLGDFLVIDEDYMVDFFAAMIGRVIDLVLMFDLRALNQGISNRYWNF